MLLQVVTVLLEAVDEAYVNQTDCADRTALLRACERGHVAVAKLLLKKATKLEVAVYYSKADEGQEKVSSALAAACKGGYIELVSRISLSLCSRCPYLDRFYVMTPLMTSGRVCPGGRAAEVAVEQERVVAEPDPRHEGPAPCHHHPASCKAFLRQQ